MSMIKNEIEFELRTGTPVSLVIKDPVDGKRRTYKVGLALLSVSRVGQDAAGQPQYQIASVNTFVLTDPPASEVKR